LVYASTAWAGILCDRQQPERGRSCRHQCWSSDRTGFVISGAIAGLAGALWLARFGTVDATAAEGIELSVITSTVEASPLRRVGTVVGAVLGALLLSVFSSTLVFLRVPSFWQHLLGAMLLLATRLMPTWRTDTHYACELKMEPRMSQSQPSTRRLARRATWETILALLLVAVVGGTFNKDFLTVENWSNLR
jgi:ribose/xylose/arabinose/galactoside ABC-type transport system permease subunit